MNNFMDFFLKYGISAFYVSKKAFFSLHPFICLLKHFPLHICCFH